MDRRLLRMFAGLSLISAGLGCGVGAGPHEATLWRQYREQGPAAEARGLEPLFAMDQPLDRSALVAAVLARNPGIAAARQALRAALAEIPQASALADPMVGYEIAPLSVVGDRLGHSVTIRQRLPFPGKRRLAANAALARAEVEAADVDVVRLELAQAASDLYDDYYVAAQALEINEHHRVFFEQIKQSAEAQYIVGRASQQDPIQAEVELAQLARERIMLDAERDQITARLDGLLHRAPTAKLPAPPAEFVVVPAPTGTSAELQEVALRRLPQRAAAIARVKAARAGVEVAERAFYPDFELMGSYNSMWAMTAHQWMVGVMVEVPVQRGPRHAAVDQAEAATMRAGFEDDRLADAIRVEVELAHRRVIEATALVAVHVDKLVPAARAQVDSARAGFASAQNSFLAVVAAQNNLRESELQLVTARAELSRRNAALARAVGMTPGLAEGGV